MATTALPSTIAGPAGIRIRASAAGAIGGIVAFAVSAIELAIADRKYGIFTGGFGQLHAADTLGERVAFIVAYILSQTALAALVWSALAALRSGRGAARVALDFAFLFGGTMLFALVARYQLHSYFSDAVDFALLKSLGGGSFKDALLFSKNELALGLAALAGLAGAWWVVARLARRWLPATPMARPRWRGALGLGALWLAALALVPRVSEDAGHALDRMVGWSLAETLAAAATDFDRDGYGVIGAPGDAQPFDPARHPLALDIPGDGIDQDGYGGDLELVPVPRPRPATLVSAGSPNLILVVFESTRGEAIGKRIDGRLVAPNLTALARGGGAVVPSYSHAGFTTQSLKSIFAGDLAPARGAPSLFTELKRSGYAVSVFSGQPEDFGDISATVGMRASADRFVDAEALRDKRAFSFAAQGSLLVDENVLLEAFDSALGRPQAWAQPQFVYLNFQSPHFPYDHPGVERRFADPPIDRAAISAANRAAVERTYWNAVAHADAALGALIARLKALGQWDRTVLLVTGDHGEALFEDGFLGHGHVIERRQYATFLAANRPLELTGPIVISDYRAIALDLLRGRTPAAQPITPFMHVGELDRPSTIGMAGTPFGIVTLRLDRGDVCFEAPARCLPYAQLTGERRRAADAVVARWGSERWARHAR